MVVEVLEGGDGELICCGRPMRLVEENIVDAAREKHVPIVDEAEGVVKVTAGSVPHPTEPNHFIQWVEVIADGRLCRELLRPGQRAEAIFRLPGCPAVARAYCNLHGLWKG